MKKSICFLVLSFIYANCYAQTCTDAFTIVILGSSTAAGTGASVKDSAWAYKYVDYLQKINANYKIYNLALGGTTTYAMQPTDYTPPANRPSPDPGRNITKALSLNPDAIIINFPSNDAADSYLTQEQKDNFTRVTDSAAAHDVPVWVATTQPRNNLNAQQTQTQETVRDWIKTYYGVKAIDFWTDLATPKDSIVQTYSYGDGIHLNNAGHEILYERVVNEDIPDTLCARSAVLPVKLISFIGYSDKNSNVLKWQTASEISFSSFKIEKSRDRNAWNNIGEVPADDGGAQIKDYSFADMHITIGTSLYRLKIVDIDGSFTYSNIISLLRRPDNANAIEIYPNPVGDKLYITGLKENSLTGIIKIIDTQGRVMYATDHLNSNNINVNYLSTGIYILVLEDLDQKIKFVKK